MIHTHSSFLILSHFAASLVEIKRKQVAADHGLLDKPKAVIPISVFWLMPQFSVHGLREVFMSVGHLEFLYYLFPESTRSTAVALSSISISIGIYIGTFLVSAVHKYTGHSDGGNWLSNRNLDRGRLEYYYCLVSGIQAVNVIYYVTMASLYTQKPSEEIMVKVGDVEDGKGEAEHHTEQEHVELDNAKLNVLD